MRGSFAVHQQHETALPIILHHWHQPTEHTDLQEVTGCTSPSLHRPQFITMDVAANAKASTEPIADRILEKCIVIYEYTVI